MFLSRLLFIFLILCTPHGIALDTNDDDKATELSLQKDEIFERLSTLVGKTEKTDDKKTQIKVKIADLQDAVKILQNEEDRKKVIKALSALALLNQEARDEQGFIENISAKITQAIEISSETVINGLKLTKHIPHIISDQILQITEDEAYRHNIYILSMILLIAILGAASVEFIARRSLRWLRVYNDEQDALKPLQPKIVKKIPTLQYDFKNIHICILKNITPIILFGLVGYLIIYLSQPKWNIITYRGFIFMNILIMIRSMWLLISVLFENRPTDEKETVTKAQNVSFQFAVAGIQTIIIGIIFGKVGALLGMGDLAVNIWLKIIGFGVTSLIVIGMVKNKAYIKKMFRADDENLSGVALFIAKFIEFVFRKAHIIFSVLAINGFILWTVKLELVAFFIAKALILTGALCGLFIIGRFWITKTIIKTKIKLQLKKSTRAKVGLSYLEGSTMNIIQSIWHLLFILTMTQIWGANPIEFAASPKIQPILSKIISILIILVVIRTLWGWVDHIAQSHIRGRLVGKRVVQSSQFVKTVTPILNSVAHWVLAIMAVILILIELGQDVRPMLYSLGVIGFAITLGAQSLVKDIITGILTLMEGNIAVGEVVTIGAFTGTVESLSLRSLVLRHGNGALQTIPFSEVSNIINKSRDYTIFPVNLLIPHKEDTVQARTLLEQTFADISNDPVFGKMILEPLTISGIDKITDTGINITGSIKIKPDPGNNFAKAFNTYLQKQMDAAEFYPPASQKVLNVNM